jgi:transcriptional regulator with XRE-family HTH domain
MPDSTVTARWAAQRATFARHLEPLVASAGGPAAVAKRLGVAPATVAAWTDGTAIPYLRNLVRLADTMRWDLAGLLAAAGRPPVPELRDATARDRRGTLPALLTAWQRKRGVDTTAAGEHFGVSRHQFSRWVAGSDRPITLQRIRTLADGLDVDMGTVLEACAYTADDPLVAEHRAGTAGAAGLIRRLVERAGYNSYSPAEVRLVARKWGLEAPRLAAYLVGDGDVSLPDAQRIASGAPLDLEIVLRAAGYGPDVALAIHQARRAARAAAEQVPAGQPLGHHLTAGEVLAHHRQANGLSQQEAVERVGRLSHAHLSRMESGAVAYPRVHSLSQMAKATGAPLSEVLTAAGLVLAR